MKPSALLSQTQVSSTPRCKCSCASSGLMVFDGHADETAVSSSTYSSSRHSAALATSFTAHGLLPCFPRSVVEERVAKELKDRLGSPGRSIQLIKFPSSVPMAQRSLLVLKRTTRAGSRRDTSTGQRREEARVALDLKAGASQNSMLFRRSAIQGKRESSVSEGPSKAIVRSRCTVDLYLG